MKILITGSAGLIGSSAVDFYCKDSNNIVVGIDNNMRQYFFGEEGSVINNMTRLQKYSNYSHLFIDISHQFNLRETFIKYAPFDLIIHCASQPSHDWSAKDPITDFRVNALATLYLLEMTRQYSKDAVFIFTSTNKVYGDSPNKLPLVEKETRSELDELHPFYQGIDETMSIDNSTHSPFGASKVAADVMCQEYGKYFGLKTTVFRGGCLTGSKHAGAELHGFLNYLARCILTGKTFKIYGYKGKQVRDNIHSSDVIKAFDLVLKNPGKGNVYNLGGGRFSNCSILEAIKKIEDLTGKKANIEYINIPRTGDHMWYISNMNKFKRDYPSFELEYDIDKIIKEIVENIEVNI